MCYLDAGGTCQPRDPEAGESHLPPPKTGIEHAMMRRLFQQLC